LGDSFIVISGLFDDVTDPMPAQSVVQYSLTCLDTIEELNILMNAALQLRVGVYSGGELYVRVSQRKHDFHVVGTPLTIARTLESHATPGTVNVSGSTYRHICNGQYQIELHEPVDVPGIGKEETYTVSAARRVQGSGSRYKAPMVQSSGSMHMSMFQVPTLNQLMNSSVNPDGSVSGTAGGDGFALPSVDFLVSTGLG
jgi:hypothetical protein